MTPKEEADPPVAEGVEEAEAKDPRINQKSSSVTSMVQSQTTPRITAQKRRKPLIEWK